MTTCSIYAGFLIRANYYSLPLWRKNYFLWIHPIFNRLRLFKQSDVSGQPEFWKYWMKTEKISPRAQRNSEETGQGDSQSHQVEFQKVMTYKQYMWSQIKRWPPKKCRSAGGITGVWKTACTMCWMIPFVKTDLQPRDPKTIWHWFENSPTISCESWEYSIPWRNLSQK